jgi:hypothetical protein
MIKIWKDKGVWHMTARGKTHQYGSIESVFWTISHFRLVREVTRLEASK